MSDIDQAGYVRALREFADSVENGEAFILRTGVYTNPTRGMTDTSFTTILAGQTLMCPVCETRWVVGAASQTVCPACGAART